VEPVEPYICEHCGAETLNPRHICRPKLEKVNFVCMTCGRVAQLPGDLCNPRDIVLSANQAPSRRIS
jgi:DNA-directed RNA polymerase subunit RPC12/RpoP